MLKYSVNRNTDCYDKDTDQYCTNLTPYRVSDSLSLIARNGVGLVIDRFGKADNPLNICLGKLAHAVNSVYLMGNSVTAVSIFNKLRKNLISSGSKSKVNKSVDIS